MDSHDLKLDKTPLVFGKYKGLTPDEISEVDPGYIVWLHTHVNPPACSEWLYEVCLHDSAQDDDTDEVY